MDSVDSVDPANSVDLVDSKSLKILIGSHKKLDLLLSEELVRQ